MTALKKLPDIPACYPVAGGKLTRKTGRILLHYSGWQIRGHFPDCPKFIMAIAPHTSNRDFFVGMAAKFAIGTHIHWMGKHSLFTWPAGALLRKLGGIPVYRQAPEGLVEQIADHFGRHDSFILAITPEGTRKKTARLKTGFIRIADKAGVPVCPVAIDYDSKEIVIGELFFTSGDTDQDELLMRKYFSQFKGHHPDQYCDI